MADSGIVLEVPRAGPDVTTRVLEAAFVVFLLLVFVGLQPFATRDPNALAINGETIAAGEGDLIRQITYLFAFVVIGFCAVQRFGARALDAVPISLALLLLWCGLSAFWSPEPAITIRRVGLEVVVVLSVMLSMNSLGVERSLKLLCYVLALVLIVNWISIPILPHQAIHQPDEVDPSIVGDWRGLYFQKNITGAVCAVSAMVFLYHAIREKKWIYWALLIGTLGFLAMTRSKSSMGLLPLGIGAAMVYRWGWRREIDRVIVSVAAVLLLAAAGLVLALYSDQIAHILSDPDEFTGRAAIWQAEIGFIRDHALLGSGFGSFADTGDLSPLHNYVGENWVQEISHGHNGYLQLIVTVGLVGFALAVLALFLIPTAAFWRIDNMNPDLKALLFGFFVFFLFHNLTESDFLESDGASWVVYLMMMAALRIHAMRLRSP